MTLGAGVNHHSLKQANGERGSNPTDGERQEGERERLLSPTRNRLTACGPKRIRGQVGRTVREDADGGACFDEEQPVRPRVADVNDIGAELFQGNGGLYLLRGCHGPEHPKSSPKILFLCHNFGQAMSNSPKWLVGDVKLNITRIMRSLCFSMYGPGCQYCPWLVW